MMSGRKEGLHCGKLSRALGGGVAQGHRLRVHSQGGKVQTTDAVFENPTLQQLRPR